MGKKFGMSNLGYAIVLVIIVGIIMIISAPMIVTNIKDKDGNPNNISDRKNLQNYDKDKINDYNNNRAVPENNTDYNYENRNSQDATNNYGIRDLEQRLNSRIDNLEVRLNDFINNMQAKSNKTDNYVCSIEGRLDANNNVVPIDNQQDASDLKTQKFVFVCQYK